MNMQQFSKVTGLTAYTIRYYEKIGVFKNISRNSSGHREFSGQDILWAGFIKRLKDTAMPLEQIIEYAQLREQGEHTSVKRLKILENHAKNLEINIKQEQNNLMKLKEKIQYYKSLPKTS